MINFNKIDLIWIINLVSRSADTPLLSQVTDLIFDAIVLSDGDQKKEADGTHGQMTNHHHLLVETVDGRND